MGQKFTMKVSDGTVWNELYPKSTSDQVSLDKPIQVMLPEKIGPLRPGEVLSEGTTMEDFIKKIVQTQIPPKYTKPSVTLVPTIIEAYEVGTRIDPVLTAGFIKGDAGDLIKLTILKDDEELASSVSDAVLTVSDIGVVVADVAVHYKAVAQYNEGIIKTDNYHEPHPEGHITAGSKTSNVLTVVGQRRSFIDVDHFTKVCTTSEDVRQLKSVSALKAGDSFTIIIPAGAKRCTIAYPDTVRDISKIKYEEGGYDVKSLFVKSTVNVEGVSGYKAAPYKVYTMIAAQPFPTGMLFTVTI